LPAHIAADDLNGDGLGDLVAVTLGSDQGFVWLQVPPALRGPSGALFTPSPQAQFTVGINPVQVSLVDMDGDGRKDIVVANYSSGDLSVVRNLGAGAFAAETRFRAGPGLYALAGSPASVQSREGTIGVVAGRLGPSPDLTPDLVVTNSGANSFSVLEGDGSGGFLNPTLSHTYGTGIRPTATVTADFNGDGFPDLVVLNEDSGDLSIYLGDGLGGFHALLGHTAAGNLPVSLAAADVNRDGNIDLVVGNVFGDILVLLGNGDGTFRPYQRSDRGIPLAVSDLDSNGQDDFIFADAAFDKVSVAYNSLAPTGDLATQQSAQPVLGPGAVKLIDLNGDGVKDLVVANSGSNNVLVFLGNSNGTFQAARSFFAGTNPVSLTVADVNSDGTPDLVVANEGSNDVSVLFGKGQGSSWTLTSGPRLQTGGTGPVSTVVQDVTGPTGQPDGIPDILVSNSSSTSVSILPGIG
jgi:hypothetical protein